MGVHRRVLFVLRDYPPDESPNGQAAKNIAQMLIENYKCNVDVICAFLNDSYKMEDIIDNIHIYRIDTYYKLYENAEKKYKSYDGNFLVKFIYRMYQRIYREIISAVPTYITRQMSTKLAYKKSLELYRLFKYDLIISVSNQFYPHFTCLKLKKKLNNRIKWIVYMMDPYADNKVRNENLSRRVIEENSVFKTCDRIFAVNEIVKTACYSPIIKYKDKLVITCVSNLVDNTFKLIENNSDSIHFCYAGLFYENIREPYYMLDLFISLPSNYILHLYTKGWEDILNKYKMILQDKLVIHGYVNQKELHNAYKKANILVTIGNKIDNQSPSKILEYISTGKPILNIYSIDNDTSKIYLDKYPLSLQIRNKPEELKTNIIKVEEFSCNNKDKLLTFNEATQHIQEYKLSNIVKKIYSEIDETGVVKDAG